MQTSYPTPQLNSDNRGASDSDTAPISDGERSGTPQLKLTLGERVFYVGHTGSGKTYLATQFLEKAVPARLPVVVIDPKGMFDGGQAHGWEYVDGLPRGWERQIRRRKNPHHLRLVVRPFEKTFYENPLLCEPLNAIYERVFKAGRCLIYLDEIQALCRPARAHGTLARLVQQGRQKRVSVWGSTLRPANVPRMFISESDHIFSFFLRDKADRDRMAEVIGEAGKAVPGPGKHDYWYQPPGVALPVLVHQETNTKGGEEQ